jgi:uncharacterized protein (DUF305 family)
MQSFHAKFISTLLLFLGTGFVSGAIVHSAGVFAWYEFILLCLGGLLFTTGAYLQVQQSLVQPKGKISNYLLLSFGLSIGIGVLSGGVQHFLDTPRFAVFMISLGLPLGGLLYLIREQALTKQTWLRTSAAYIGIGLVLAGITYPIALRLDPGHGHAVANEREFLRAMVPHHREAVTSSSDILTRTTNEAIADFARSTIEIQSSEITTMTGWYRTWYGESFNASRYSPMMPVLEDATGPEAEQSYLAAMIEHHEAAITMADSVITTNPRAEVLQIAQSIVRSQKDEVRLLEELLQENIRVNGDIAADSTGHSH